MTVYRWPLARLYSEAKISRRRINNRIVTDAVMMQAVIGAVFCGSKGAKHLRELVSELTDAD